ncbi:glucose-6-phosphate 1-dehydrogenase [Planotetraspora thailandica]|uniref:Glucose-6-phosphate 1-dehydrogenase n=1 Tax=Planotetraspora thailandica TaxID=487172 RepID=A0A8J3XW25_9ACTN|nr:glucose-6-phosphate dehydrogenase [Planotetraspora thailandica]GII57142.1 glucose-6-phosphate 1-dehydrogenase [Planotetraspora thailandica]
MNARQGQVLVLYGIGGDLAKKLIIPALYRLTQRKALDLPVIGVDHGRMDLDALRRHARDSVTAAYGRVDEAVFDELASRLGIIGGDLTDAATYDRIGRAITEAGGDALAVHYLAVPPSLFGPIAEGLDAAGLAAKARLVVEKPFGHDLASAERLNEELHRHFPEERLLRVDHFLGKDAVENLMVFRLANSILEPVWNRSHVASVQITMAEAFDVADRGAFYDAVGTVRDVVQNHLLQVLAYLAMDPPSDGSAEGERDEKRRLLSAVRAADPGDMVRGQYEGYLGTPGVAAGSVTETYTALRLWIDNWRWADVPFLIRAGKALAVTATEVAVEFHRPPRVLFVSGATDRPPPNVVRFRLQPDAGVTFEMLARDPQEACGARSVRVSVDFETELGFSESAYERVLAAAVSGDQRLFARQDTVEEEWRIVGPVLDATAPPEPYERGGWGPAAADRLPPNGWQPTQTRP